MYPRVDETKQILPFFRVLTISLLTAYSHHQVSSPFLKVMRVPMQSKPVPNIPYPFPEGVHPRTSRRRISVWSLRRRETRHQEFLHYDRQSLLEGLPGIPLQKSASESTRRTSGLPIDERPGDGW